MSEARRQTDRTWEAYLEWEALQPVRYELVDGRVYAMGGGTAEHTIGNNLRAALHVSLRGTPCRSHGPDLKVRAGKDGRYPDALIDCGPRLPRALYAQEPVAVFEVLSKSTSWIDQRSEAARRHADVLHSDLCPHQSGRNARHAVCARRLPSARDPGRRRVGRPHARSKFPNLA